MKEHYALQTPWSILWTQVWHKAFPKSMPLQTPIQNKDPSISTTFGVSTIGTFSIALSCPQPHVPSSIPRKKEQQRWTCVDPHHPWHLGYEYLPYLQLRCVGRWRWIGWSGWRGRRRRQRPQGQRWRQACTVMMYWRYKDESQKLAYVFKVIDTAQVANCLQWMWCALDNWRSLYEQER